MMVKILIRSSKCNRDGIYIYIHIILTFLSGSIKNDDCFSQSVWNHGPRYSLVSPPPPKKGKVETPAFKTLSHDKPFLRATLPHKNCVLS